MTALRHSGFARMVVRFIFVMLLLPHVLAAVPSPASAAERALYVDVMQSRCLDMDGDGKADPAKAAHNCNDCCVACATPRLDVPRLAVAEPVRFELPRGELTAPVELTLVASPSEAVFRPLSQRGPPA